MELSDFVIMMFIIIVVLLPFFIYIKLKAKVRDKYKQEQQESLQENEFIVDKEYSISTYTKILTDKIHRNFAIYKDSQLYYFSYEDLINFEVIENGSSVIQSKTTATLVGGFLLGGIGALAGSSGAKKVSNMCDSLILKIYLNNEEINCISENIKSNNYPISKNSEEYRMLSNKVDNIVGILKYIKAQSKEQNSFIEDNKIKIDSNDNGFNEKSIYGGDNDNLEQLEKLADLKEKGIITEEEFAESKKKLLSKL